MMVGDKLPGMVPSYGATCTGFASDGESYTATVVYIHPQRRFYTVEFAFARGRRFRESFYFQDRAGGAPLAGSRDCRAEGKNRRGAKNEINGHCQENQRARQDCAPGGRETDAGH